jgi:actin-related protein
MEVARELKERLAYVRMVPAVHDADEEGHDAEEEYELPDGQVISIGIERSQCAEVLFQPSLTGTCEWGVHEAVHFAVSKCDDMPDVRQNILACGGTSMLRGFADRLADEIRRKASGQTIGVIANRDRHCSAWIGGSLLASRLQQHWITRAEYEELGPMAVHRCTRRQAVGDEAECGVESQLDEHG